MRFPRIFTRQAAPTLPAPLPVKTRAGGGFNNGALNFARQGFGGLTRGGVYNPRSGQGGLADKNDGGLFLPTRIWNRQELEIIHVESSAARKFVDIIPNDMTVRWRQWKDEAELLNATEKQLNLKHTMARVMKAARLYGTGILVPITREAPPEMPLDLRMIRPGDLVGLKAYNRFACSVLEWNIDGKPTGYYITPTRGVPFRAHASRVIRFEGLEPLDDDGFTIYDRDWGLSRLIPAINAILSEVAAWGAAGHLMNEASIPVLGIKGFREALAGSPDADDDTVDPQVMAEEINLLKSIYRMLTMDATDSFTRVAVAFGGVADILDRHEKRMASIAEIPQTRWSGAPPVGFNSTGEHDMANHAVAVKTEQVNYLEPGLAPIDAIIARHLGMAELPEYEWLSLQDTSDKDQADVAKVKTETLSMAAMSGFIDEDEGRRQLDGDPLYGELKGPAMEPPPADAEDDKGQDSRPAAFR